MGFTFIASTYADYWDVDDVIDTVGTLNVAAGDLLVAVVGFSTTARTITSVADTVGGNAHTMGSVTNSGDMYGAMGYKIAATANSTSTFRLTLSGTTTQPSLLVLQFRPDAGETVTLVAGDSVATGTSAAPQTANFSTTGADQMIVGGLSMHYQTTASSPLIADAAADGSAAAIGQYDTWGWYKAFTTTQTDIHAQITSTYAAWIAMALAFKSEAAGDSTADSTTLSDSASAAAESQSTSGDGATLSDSAVSAIEAQAQGSDGVSLADVAGVSVIWDVVVTDGAVFTDAPLADGVNTYSVAVSDGVALGDANTMTGEYGLAVTDGAAFADADDSLAEWGVTASDGVVLTDSGIANAVWQALVSSGLSLDDIDGNVAHFQVFAADGAVLSDSAIDDDSQILVDGLTFGDGATVFVERHASVRDGVTLSDISRSQAVGTLTVTFTAAGPVIGFTATAPGVSYSAKRPTVTFT